MTDEELVVAYLKYATERDDSLFWAWQQVKDCVDDEPLEGWKITLQLIEASSTPEILSYVAAGPLEDLLNAHGQQFIDEVEILSRRNPKFREALRGVWLSSAASSEFRARFIKAAT